MPNNYDAIEDVKFRDWEFKIVSSVGREYLQVWFYVPDVERTKILHEKLSGQFGGEVEVSGVEEMSLQLGRKWLLSPAMTRGEVVQTAFKAVMCAMEHEVREEFTYKDAAIFGPHFDVDQLVEICQNGGVKIR